MDNIRWVSAHLLSEAITKQLEREYASSRPRPRNRAMGFRGEDKVKKRRDQTIALLTG